MNGSLISHMAPVLGVQNMERALSFYTEKLGFELSFQWGNPIDYAVIKVNEAVKIHLSLRPEMVAPNEEGTTILLFCFDLDQLYAHCIQKGINIKNPIGDRAYGMRDFDIIDSDGHVITFTQGLA